MRSLLSLLGTVSLVSTCSTKQKTTSFFTVVRSDRAAFCTALSGRVRPCGNMPQTPCPVNERRHMQGFPLLLEEDRPAYVRQETDTAHPHTPIPIFYIHDLPTPFCTNPLCFCQRRRHDAARFLGEIAKASVLLLDAAALIDERREAAMSNTTRATQQTRTVIYVDLIRDVPEECQLYGHSWQQTEHQDVKECVLCQIRGYCPGCSPIAPAGAQPFTCTPHARQRKRQ